MLTSVILATLYAALWLSVVDADLKPVMYR
jgi:hypothetical protein